MRRKGCAANFWNRPAPTRFVAKALSTNGIPYKAVIDKSGANAAGTWEVNKTLKRQFPSAMTSGFRLFAGPAG
jgi:transposase-like protein